MLKLQHESTLDYYIKKYELNDLFDIDLKKHLELHCFNKDELICIQNQNLEYFYFLVDGSATSFNNFYRPLSFIGEIEIFSKSKYTYSIKTLEECMCIGIHRDMINDIFLNDIKFLRYFCKNFSKKLSNNFANYIDLNKEKRDII